MIKKSQSYSFTSISSILLLILCLCSIDTTAHAITYLQPQARADIEIICDSKEIGDVTDAFSTHNISHYNYEAQESRDIIKRILLLHHNLFQVNFKSNKVSYRCDEKTLLPSKFLPTNSKKPLDSSQRA